MGGPDIERRLFLRELAHAIGNVVKAKIERELGEHEAAGLGPWCPEEVRQRDARSVAWVVIEKWLDKEPDAADCFAVEDGEQRMTPTGIIYLTLNAIGYRWGDERDRIEARNLLLLYLDQWEMGCGRTPIV